MSTNTKRSAIPSLIYLVILVGLVYMFHTELFVTGIRLYVAATPNPKAEQLLGDYYQKNAQLSGGLAKAFYTSSMKKYQDQLTTASSEQQAHIKLSIGRMYLCGKGVEPNNAEAKRWFTEALSLANHSNPKVPEMLVTEINDGISFANQGNHKSTGNINTIPLCHLQSETEFFNMLKP